MVEPSKIKELYGVYRACIGIFVCIYRFIRICTRRA